MTTGRNRNASWLSRALGALNGSEALAALRGGAILEALNPAQVGPASPVTLNGVITPRNGGRILAIGVINAQGSAANVTVAGAIHNVTGNYNLPGNSLPATSAAATGGDGSHSVSMTVIGLDTPQAAGTPVTYQLQATAASGTLTSNAGELQLLLLEWGNGT